jgi:hypothetical protein
MHLSLLDPYKNLPFIGYPGEINATYEVSIVILSIFAGSIYLILLFFSDIQSFLLRVGSLVGLDQTHGSPRLRVEWVASWRVPSL